MMKHEFHKYYPEYAQVAGEGGVLRLCVAGQTMLLVTTPAAFAAVLQKTGFLPKPLSIYGGLFMFVRPLLFSVPYVQYSTIGS